MAFLVQFTASLLAIVVLAWFARRLGLGRDVRIRDEEHAQLLADEVVFGFEALRTAVDKFGRAALLQDAAGRVILVKLHGAQFSGRLLGPEAEAVILGDLKEGELQVSSGEWLFGKATLNIANPDHWAKAFKPSKEPTHA